MAIRTFNSVGGFSVGENPETIILPNGDITTDFATFTANVDAGKIKTDYLLHADGTPWDFQLPAGSTNGQIQYYLDGDFGASTKFVFDPTSNVLTVTGNIAATNLSTTGNASITGNISGNNATIGNNASFGGNITVTGNANVESNLNLTGNANVTGNISGNNLAISNNATVSGNIAATGNVSGNNATFSNNATVSGNVSVTGNVSGNNATFGNNASFGGNITVTGNANVESNLNVTANANVTGDINATGDITGNNISATGTLTTTGSISAPRFSGNVNISSTDKSVIFTKGGNIYYSSNLQFDYTSNVLTLAGNLFTTNANLGNLAIANYFSGTLDTLSNAQPNITSVGTLTNLTVAGNVNTANTYTSNLSVTGKVITSLLPSSTGTYDLGSSSYAWRNVWVDTNIFIGGATGYIGAIGNVIQVDALTAANALRSDTLTVSSTATLQGDVTVSGNLTVGGTTTYINVSSLDVKDPLISLGGSGSGANLTHYDGKDRGLVLRNRTADDIDVRNQAFIWNTANSEFRILDNVTGPTVDVVGQGSGVIYANLRGETFFGNLDGTILTASQTNITDVGMLNNLEVDGTLTVYTHANVNSLEASGLQYPTSDGTQRQVLSTDGEGSLYWATIDTYRLANGTSNVQVYGPGPDNPTGVGGNVAITVAGSANIVVVDTTGANIAGNLKVSDTTTTTTLSIDQTKVRGAHVTTTSIASTTVATILTADFRAVEFFIKGEDLTGHKYSVATISAVHDSSGNVEWSTYGGVHSGASTGTFDVVYDDTTDVDNHRVVLKVTPSSSNSTDWTVQYRLI